MKKFMSFERMLTPIIIKIFFWIGLVLSLLTGIGVFIGALVMGFNEGSVGGILLGLLGGFLGGAISFLLLGLITRIYAELLILAFRINETLTDIKQLLQKD